MLLTKGVQFVRGAEVFEIRDEDDVPLNDYTRYIGLQFAIC